MSLAISLFSRVGVCEKNESDLWLQSQVGVPKILMSGRGSGSVQSRGVGCPQSDRTHPGLKHRMSPINNLCNKKNKTARVRTVMDQLLVVCIYFLNIYNFSEMLVWFAKLPPCRHVPQ